MKSNMLSSKNQPPDINNPTKVLYKLCEHILSGGGKKEVHEGKLIIIIGLYFGKVSILEFNRDFQTTVSHL